MKTAIWFAAGGLVGIALTLAVTHYGATHQSTKMAAADSSIGDMLNAMDARKPPSAAMAAGGNAPPLEEATARLERRLASGGGSEGDWQLLARSYEFLGRSDDAARARAHRAVGGK